MYVVKAFIRTVEGAERAPDAWQKAKPGLRQSPPPAKRKPGLAVCVFVVHDASGVAAGAAHNLELQSASTASPSAASPLQ